MPDQTVYRGAELRAVVPSPLEGIVAELERSSPRTLIMRMTVPEGLELRATLEGPRELRLVLTRPREGAFETTASLAADHAELPTDHEDLRAITRAALAQIAQAPGTGAYRADALVISAIAQETWQPSEALPTMTRLAEMWGIARSTLSYALTRLGDHGVIRSTGRGGRCYLADDASPPPLTSRNRLIAELRGRIARGEVLAGHVLPSRVELMEEFGLSWELVHRAQAQLCDDGDLVRRDDGLYAVPEDPHALNSVRVIEGDELGGVAHAQEAWNLSKGEVHTHALRLWTRLPDAVITAQFGGSLPPETVRLDLVWLPANKRHGHATRRVEGLERMAHALAPELIAVVTGQVLDWIRSESLRARIAQWVVSARAAGDLRAGSVLSPGVPAELFNVRRSTVVAAFRSMCRLGILVEKPRRVFVVADPG